MKLILNKILALLDNRMIYALLVTGIAFCLSMGNTVYQTNDDPAMRGIIEGIMFNPKAPSEYVLFINVIYCRVLKFLYETFPDFYWYDFLFTCLLIISAIVISAVMLVKNDKCTLKIIVTLLLVLAYKIAFSNLQFTIVAGMLACSAMLLLFYVFMKESVSRKLYIFTFIYVLSSLVISAQIRFEMMCLTVLCAGVLSLVLINRHIFNKKLLLLGIPVALGIMLSFMASIYNYNEYAKLNMQFNPIDYNAAKSEIADKNLPYFNTLDRPDVIKVLEKNGWTKNDIQLIQRWGYTGTGFFNYDNMKKMAEELGPIVQGSWTERLQVFILLMRNTMNYYNHLFVILLLLCVSSRVLQARIAVAHILFWMLFFGLACVFRPLPFRVYFSLNLLELFFMILLVRKDFALKNVANLFDKLSAFVMKILYSSKFVKLRLSSKGVIPVWILCFIYAVLNMYLVIAIYPHKPNYSLYNDLNKFELNEEGVAYILPENVFVASFIPYKPVGINYTNVYFTLGWGAALLTSQKKFKYDFYDLLVDKKIKFISTRSELDGWAKDKNDFTITFLQEHKNLYCENVWDKHINGNFTYYVGYYDCEKNG